MFFFCFFGWFGIAPLMKIVKDAGFKGIVGIEFEGEELSEDEGIKATLKLLQKVGGILS